MQSNYSTCCIVLQVLYSLLCYCFHFPAIGVEFPSLSKKSISWSILPVHYSMHFIILGLIFTFLYILYKVRYSDRFIILWRAICFPKEPLFKGIIINNFPELRSTSIYIKDTKSILAKNIKQKISRKYCYKNDKSQIKWY